MGTHAFITVKGLSAGLYRHSDGYPDGPHGVLSSLAPFVAHFKKYRGDDPEYFLARLVENQLRATGLTVDKKPPFGPKTENEDYLIGFGIIVADPKDVDQQFHYHVNLETGVILVNGKAV